MPLSFTAAIRRNAVGRPDHLALSDLVTDLTWAQLGRRVNQVANGLRAQGISRGDRICYLGHNSITFYELMYGAMVAGAVLAPLNWRLMADDIAALVEDAGADLLVHDPEFTHLVPDGVRTIEIGSAFDSWRDDHSDAAPPGPDDASDDTVLQSYTSGTTGLPKGTLITTRMYEVSWQAARRMYGIGPDCVVAITMPVHHVGGTVPASYVVAEGGTLVITRGFDEEETLDLIESHRVTFMALAPIMVTRLAAAHAARPRDLSSLQRVMYGGQSASRRELEFIFSHLDIELFQTYGMTEVAGGPITHLSRADHEGVRLASAGRIVDHYEAACHTDDGRRLPDGEVGEIWLRSEQTTPGYWRREEATAALYGPDGWLRTGDVGYLDPDGYLFIIDRLKDMIVTGGENVYPAEVERVLIEHPEIAEVAVVGFPDPTWGEMVVAFVVPIPGATPEPAAVIEWTRDRIAGFRRPRAVHVVDQLPRNASGKILRRSLRASHETV